MGGSDKSKPLPGCIELMFSVFFFGQFLLLLLLFYSLLWNIDLCLVGKASYGRYCRHQQ